MIISLHLLLPLQGAHLRILLPRALALGYTLLPLRGVQPRCAISQTEQHGQSVNIRYTPMQRTANKMIRATEGHGLFVERKYC